MISVYNINWSQKKTCLKKKIELQFTLFGVAYRVVPSFLMMACRFLPRTLVNSPLHVIQIEGESTNICLDAKISMYFHLILKEPVIISCNCVVASRVSVQNKIICLMDTVNSTVPNNKESRNLWNWWQYIQWKCSFNMKRHLGTLKIVQFMKPQQDISWQKLLYCQRGYNSHASLKKVHNQVISRIPC